MAPAAPTAIPRKALICESSKPICPKCGQLIRRINPLAGAIVAWCENRHQGPNPERTFACGQHVHIVGTTHGICIVVPITPREFDELRENPALRADDLYRAVGIIGSAA